MNKKQQPIESEASRHKEKAAKQARSKPEATGHADVRRRDRYTATAAPRSTTSPERTGAPPDTDDWVTLARLVRPRGLKGEVLAEIETDFPERFAERRSLFLRTPAGRAGGPGTPRPVILDDHWPHQGRLVMKFSGIDSMTEAEALRGHEVVIPRAQRAPLEDGAVYIADLVGCELWDLAADAGQPRNEPESQPEHHAPDLLAGRLVGKIVDVDRESANMPLLVVRTPTGEALIPFANAYQPGINLEARRMEMTLPAGLIELNTTPDADESKGSGALDASVEQLQDAAPGSSLGMAPVPASAAALQPRTSAAPRRQPARPGRSSPRSGSNP